MCAASCVVETGDLESVYRVSKKHAQEIVNKIYTCVTIVSSLQDFVPMLAKVWGEVFN